jgi:hypothetical protein
MIIEHAPFCLLCYWYVPVLGVVGLTMLSPWSVLLSVLIWDWVAWLVYWIVVYLGTLVPVRWGPLWYLICSLVICWLIYVCWNSCEYPCWDWYLPWNLAGLPKFPFLVAVVCSGCMCLLYVTLAYSIVRVVLILTVLCRMLFLYLAL